MGPPSPAKPFAVSLGDPAGIGPEVTCKAWEQRREQGLPPFFVVGCLETVAGYWNGPTALIDDPSQAINVFPDALPIFRVEESREFSPGRPSAEGAQIAFRSLEIATGFARTGRASGLVTAPVCKAQLYSVGFTHPGQTEFIAERCGVSRTNAVMMLAGPSLRVVPMTTHIPLGKVLEVLTVERVVSHIHATARGLKRNFGITRPRLAIAGINPHAGEMGKIGDDEERILVPAIREAREAGIDIGEPQPADTMFHGRAREQYDAALCAYHDQALVPLKTLHFDEAVNITLGLPIVRTSPDHGTAFDIAGQSRAHPGSMIAALKLAQQACIHRAAEAA